MDDLENPFNSKIINLNYHYKLFKNLANGVAEDQLEDHLQEYRQEEEINVTVAD